MAFVGRQLIPAPHGQLEAIYRPQTDDAARVALVLHPHPLYGGTMHNKVVYRIAKAFEHAGFAVLRFNFRGAGRSHGAHDQGRGEQDDLRAAIRFVEDRYREAEIWLAGFSFGAAVMLRAGCEDPRTRALIAVGVPVSKYDFSQAQNCAQPKLFVQGSLDEFGAIADLERFVAALDEPKRLKVIEGAGHFFEDKLDELVGAISGFIKEQTLRQD